MSSHDPFLSNPTLWTGWVGAYWSVFPFEETTEFERLDVSLPYDRKPLNCTSAIVPLEPTEIRWLELYRKHRAAFEAMQNKSV